MALEDGQPEEFIIPTKYKLSIGSYLSWPLGAKELTKAFSGIPQLKELQLAFWESYPKFPKGKWPASFRVIEAKYSPISAWNNIHWLLTIHPVPRMMRAEVRNSLSDSGLKEIADWFIAHVNFSGRDCNLSYVGYWNSELKELSFGSHEYIVPETSKERKSQAR